MDNMFPCIRRGATTKCRFHVLATPHLEKLNVSFRVLQINKCEKHLCGTSMLRAYVCVRSVFACMSILKNCALY